MKIISVVALVLLVAHYNFAQNVRGTVVDKNGDPIEFVNVILYSHPDSAFVKAELSDTVGKYSVSLPSNNQYYLEFQMLGLGTTSTLPFSGETVLEPVVLSEDVHYLKTTTITVQKPMIEKTGRGMIVNVSSSPILSNGNTKEVLSKIPGVVVHQDGSVTLKGKSNVVIYIDDKPTYMSLEDLVRLLEGTPASEIEKVEVYDTPPAKFDAAGSAGIINFVRKRGVKVGLNGSAGLNMGYGNFHKFSPWVYANYRNKKFNVYGSTWYYNNKYDHRTSAAMHMENDGMTTTYNNSYHPTYHPHGTGIRLGADWFLGEKNTLGALILTYTGESDGEEPATTTIEGHNPNDYNYASALRSYTYWWKGITYNLNFKRDIAKGEALTIDADLVQRYNGNDQSNLNEFFNDNTALTPSLVDISGKTDIDIIVGKLDYEKTIFKDWALETGLKSSWVNTSNAMNNWSGTNKSDLVLDFEKANTFDYSEAIYAGYVAMAKKWKDRWSFDIVGDREVRSDYMVYITMPQNTFKTISASFQMSVEELKEVNYTTEIHTYRPLRVRRVGDAIVDKQTYMHGNKKYSKAFYLDQYKRLTSNGYYKKDEPFLDPADGEMIYEVLPKNTMYRISRLFGMTVDELKVLNNMDGTQLFKYQPILVKVASEVPDNHYYLVKENDTLESIAANHNLSKQGLVMLNNFGGYVLSKGMVLMISSPEGE